MNFYDKLTDIVGKDKITELLEEHKKRNSLLHIFKDSERDIIRALCVSYLVSEKKQWLSIKDNALIDLMSVDKKIFQSILDRQCKLFGGRKGRRASASTHMGVEYRTFLMLSDLGTERFATNNLALNNKLNINNNMNNTETKTDKPDDNKTVTYSRGDSLEIGLNGAVHKITIKGFSELDRSDGSLYVEYKYSFAGKNKLYKISARNLGIAVSRAKTYKERKEKSSDNVSSKPNKPRHTTKDFNVGERYGRFYIESHRSVFACGKTKEGTKKYGTTVIGHMYGVVETMPDGTTISHPQMRQSILRDKLGVAICREIDIKNGRLAEIQGELPFTDSSNIKNTPGLQKMLDDTAEKAADRAAKKMFEMFKKQAAMA